MKSERVNPPYRPYSQQGNPSQVIFTSHWASGILGRARILKLIMGLEFHKSTKEAFTKRCFSKAM